MRIVGIQYNERATHWSWNPSIPRFDIVELTVELLPDAESLALYWVATGRGAKIGTLPRGDRLEHEGIQYANTAGLRFDSKQRADYVDLSPEEMLALCSK
jgi:hypothetical protein